MKQQIKISNLLGKMRDIYIFKIGGNVRSEKILY